ncbi:MAG: hypothetical protein J7647_01295 [Cyanobacteria bacterium SBLK]|nr:hypothetical protein [Cyanobacteria bacterium SBLK]
MSISEFNILGQFLSGLSLQELSQRLNIPELTLQEMSKTSDFEKWSQQQDPEGVSWKINDSRLDPSRCYLPNLGFSKQK